MKWIEENDSWETGSISSDAEEQGFPCSILTIDNWASTFPLEPKNNS